MYPGSVDQHIREKVISHQRLHERRVSFQGGDFSSNTLTGAATTTTVFATVVTRVKVCQT